MNKLFESIYNEANEAETVKNTKNPTDTVEEASKEDKKENKSDKDANKENPVVDKKSDETTKPEEKVEDSPVKKVDSNPVENNQQPTMPTTNNSNGFLDKAKTVAKNIVKNPTVRQIASNVAVGAVNTLLRNKGINTGTGYNSYYGGANSFGMY